MTRVSLTKGGKIVSGSRKYNVKNDGKSNTVLVPYNKSTKDYDSEQRQVIGNVEGTAKGAVNAYQQQNPSTPKLKEPAIISSQQGLDLVKDAQKKEQSLTPPPISANPNLTPDQQAAEDEAQKKRFAPQTAPEKNVDQPQDTVTYVNPQTEATTTLTGDALTSERQQQLQSQGYQVAESNLSSAPKETNPLVAQAEREVASAESAVTSLVSDLERSIIDDAELRSELNSIKMTYKSRIEDMKVLNQGRTQAIKTLGVRLGQQFTGGSGGIFGGIISAEEAEGVRRITAINSEMQSKLLEAKQAARDHNYRTYVTAVNAAESLRKDKVTELATLKKAQQEKEDKIAEEKKILDRQVKIADALGTGLTEPTDIFAYLKGEVPFDDILAITKELPKPETPEDFTLSEGQARYSADGKLIASRAKTYEPKAGSGSGLGGVALTSATYGALADALAGIKFNAVADREAAEARVGEKLKAGDIDGAKKLILQYAQNSFGETTSQVMIGYRQGLDALDTIETGLQSLENAGIDTNIFSGIAQGLATKLGEAEIAGIGDPALARVANDIALAIISFRRAVSGAAFTESEGAAYADVFPSIGKSNELNSQKIASLRDNFNSGIDSYLGFRIAGYDQLFKSMPEPQFIDMSNTDLINDITGEVPQTKASQTDEDYWKNFGKQSLDVQGTINQYIK